MVMKQQCVLNEVSLNGNAHDFVYHERLYQAAHRYKTLLPLGAMVHNHYYGVRSDSAE